MTKLAAKLHISDVAVKRSVLGTKYRSRGWATGRRSPPVTSWNVQRFPRLPNRSSTRSGSTDHPETNHRRFERSKRLSRQQKAAPIVRSWCRKLWRSRTLRQGRASKAEKPKTGRTWLPVLRGSRYSQRFKVAEGGLLPPLRDRRHGRERHADPIAPAARETRYSDAAVRNEEYSIPITRCRQVLPAPADHA
jgi:hypothetical protein